MKRVLIICGRFPPQSDVGGLRPAMMAKYLPEFGWEPHVLTRDYGWDHPCRDDKMRLDGMPDGDSVIRVEISAQDEREYLTGRGLLGQVRDFFHVEQSHPPGEYDKMYREVRWRLDGRRVDAIWATAPDYAPIRLGRDLAGDLGVPWVADFRDISEQEDGMPKSWREHLLRYRSILRRSQLVATAARLTSVSPYHCRLLGERLRKRCDLIYNGYDDSLFTPAPTRRADKFRIVYVGRILSQWLRDPSLLFEALDELIEQRDIEAADINVAFYGTDTEVLRSIILAYDSSRLVQIHERIAHSEVPAVLGDASVLLVLSNENRPGILTTKLFECMAINRAILCVRVRPEDDVAEILRQTKTGLGANSREEVKAFLLHAYRQWKSTGMVPVNGELRSIEEYSRRVQAGRLARSLDEVVGDPGASDRLSQDMR